MSGAPSSDPAVFRGARAVIDRLPARPAATVRALARRALGRRPPSSRDMVVPDAEFVDAVASGSDEAVCPMCGTTAPEFLSYGVKAPRPDCRCPGCGSLERHRLVWLFLGLRTDLLRPASDGATRSLLHIAPEPQMEDRFVQLPHLAYLSADLEPGKAMTVMDVTAIDQPDHSFDVVYASHVLEHVPDDVGAMSELRRILKTDGWAVLEVPMHGATTREDPSITDPRERERLFGQADHVRMYGHDGVYERRLAEAGFDVTVVRVVDELGPAVARRFRLRPDEHVHLCRPTA